MTVILSMQNVRKAGCSQFLANGSWTCSFTWHAPSPGLRKICLPWECPLHPASRFDICNLLSCRSIEFESEALASISACWQGSSDEF